MRLRSSATLVAFTAALATTAGAAPQPSRRDARSLRSSVGVGAAEPLLRAEASDVRQRAFERLGSVGTARALELLARALDNGGAARDARERLAVVRTLALHASEPTAQDALIRALGGLEGRTTERDRLVERTAALALGAAHHPLALAALARALRQPGRVSESARVALLAHPPERIEPLLRAAGVPTPALVDLLGELGDARAVPLLVRVATRSSAELEAHALLALARLDAQHAVALARTAVARSTGEGPSVAAARVLAAAADPAAPAAVAALAGTVETRSEALAIALEAPSAALGTALAALPSEGLAADRLFAALGRSGGRAALARLERELGTPDNAWSAAYALALSPDSNADGVLERALRHAETRRDALRGAVLRSVARDRLIAGVEHAAALLAHGNTSDRAASAWAHAVLTLEPAALRAKDASIVRAVARQSFVPELAGAAAERLANERDPGLRSVLAGALAVPSAADRVPTAVLVALYEEKSAASYLAAYALAVRDSDELRPRIRELLAAEDPTLRVHAALGLGRSALSSATGVLADAYRDEVDPRVRRAIVRALTQRPEQARDTTLRLAASLEPDDDARNEARRALGFAEPAGGVPGSAPAGVVWLRFVPASSGAASLAMLETPDGLMLPLAADDDGSVTAAFLPKGDVTVTLAPALPRATGAPK